MEKYSNQGKKIELFGENNLSTPKPYFKYERRIGPHNFFLSRNYEK